MESEQLDSGSVRHSYNNRQPLHEFIQPNLPIDADNLPVHNVLQLEA